MHHKVTRDNVYYLQNQCQFCIQYVSKKVNKSRKKLFRANLQDSNLQVTIFQLLHNIAHVKKIEIS